MRKLTAIPQRIWEGSKEERAKGQKARWAGWLADAASMGTLGGVAQIGRTTALKDIGRHFREGKAVKTYRPQHVNRARFGYNPLGNSSQARQLEVAGEIPDLTHKVSYKRIPQVRENFRNLAKAIQKTPQKALDPVDQIMFHKGLNRNWDPVNGERYALGKYLESNKTVVINPEAVHGYSGTPHTFFHEMVHDWQLGTGSKTRKAAMPNLKRATGRKMLEHDYDFRPIEQHANAFSGEANNIYVEGLKKEKELGKRFTIKPKTWDDLMRATLDKSTASSKLYDPVFGLEKLSRLNPTEKTNRLLQHKVLKKSHKSIRKAVVSPVQSAKPEKLARIKDKYNAQITDIKDYGVGEKEWKKMRPNEINPWERLRKFERLSPE